MYTHLYTHLERYCTQVGPIDLLLHWLSSDGLRQVQRHASDLSPEAIEDIHQTVIFKMLQQLRAIRSSLRHQNAFLNTPYERLNDQQRVHASRRLIAYFNSSIRNGVIDWRRRHQRHQGHLPLGPLTEREALNQTPVPVALERTLVNSTFNQLHACFDANGLGPTFKQVLALSELGELTYNGLFAREPDYEQNPAAARSRVYRRAARARSALFDAIQSDPSFTDDDDRLTAQNLLRALKPKNAGPINAQRRVQSVKEKE